MGKKCSFLKAPVFVVLVFLPENTHMHMDKVLLKHKPPVCEVCRRQLYVAAALNCWYLLMRHDDAQRAERFLPVCRAFFLFFCFFLLRLAVMTVCPIGGTFKDVYGGAA